VIYILMLGDCSDNLLFMFSNNKHDKSMRLKLAKKKMIWRKTSQFLNVLVNEYFLPVNKKKSIKMKWRNIILVRIGI